ncbi:MAG: asparagine synthase (glutamine-hydrolyzing) [Ruminococcus flavefaciens]|nr:asparagine synthase (glutamine-hydrolyzing) [Ruminococcus flavefaciens]
MSTDEICMMCQYQQHRGPDDKGMVAIDLEKDKIREVKKSEHPNCKGLLGFNRLSIQDFSYHGHQPMQNRTADVSIVFNGEIYNFRELRNELLKKGHVFESGTDTEVILHMYMEYGMKKTLEKLNGMFSFAITDMRSRKIYIARDRFGIKPLYIADVGETFLFASEIKAFLPYHGFTPKLNMNAVKEYMLFQNIMSDTLLEGVSQLEPGIILEYDLETNDIQVEQYFTVETYSRDNGYYSYDDLKERMRETLKAVVRRQIISDAKVGCQLSGGIDSSILTKIVVEEHRLFDTVSCKVDSTVQTDIPYIDTVNKMLKTNPHICNIDAEVFIDNLVNIVWHFDSVISHTPPAGMYQISRCADENQIRVLLSGEGADELFGGYKCFLDLASDKAMCSENDIIHKIIFRDGLEDTDFLKKVLPEIEPERFYQKRIDHLKHFTGSIFDRQIKYELTTQLRELLYRQDKMAMAHSIENRVPYLDNELVQLAWDIPEIYLMNTNMHEGKFILKDIAADFFGQDFAFRKKVGFFIPGNHYLCSNKDFIHLVLQCIRKRDVICGDILEKWAENELQVLGGLSHFRSALFFKLFTLEIWCQLFIDGYSVEECKEKLLAKPHIE